MKVICDRSALLSAINLASGAVAVRSPRPQLTCVKLVASKTGKAGTLTVLATDGEISLRLQTERVDVVKAGEALIPADKLRQIISAEENEPTLTLEVGGERCEIKGGDARFVLHGYPAAEFPPVPDFASVVAGSGGAPAKAVFSHPAGDLNSMVTRTVFATARENSRYAINGVLLKRDGKRLEMVATDGRRLALCRGTVSGGDRDGPAVSCIVATKALQMLQRLVEDADERVAIAVTESQVFFAFGAGDKGDGARAVLASTLVEGAFPPYEDVIPKEQDRKITFDRDLLASAVRRAALLTNEESRGVRMAFDREKRQVELSSRAPEMGEAEVRVALAAFDGDDIEIGFNPSFITDALKILVEPQVILELKAPNKPGVIKSGTEFLYVVMPVNLQ